MTPVVHIDEKKVTLHAEDGNSVVLSRFVNVGSQGGLTPEQYDALAKEEILEEIYTSWLSITHRGEVHQPMIITLDDGGRYDYVGHYNHGTRTYRKYVCIRAGYLVYIYTTGYTPYDTVYIKNADGELIESPSKIVKSETQTLAYKEDLNAIIEAIGGIKIPTDYATGEAVEESAAVILQAIEDGGSDDAKQAFNAMKRIKPYLYGMEYASLNYESARAHMLNAQVVPSACTTVRRGTEVGRNFDWAISHQVEFLVRTKAHNGRYATIGFCGALPTLTEDVVASGQYLKEYGYLPFYMQDGMNSEGLVASIHQLPDNADSKQAADGNDPIEEERERISAIMLVRYILDNFKSATEAAEYINNFVRVVPANVGGKQLDCHFAIADKDNTVYLAFDGNGVYMEQNAATDNFVMTNFRLAWTTLVDGYYDIEQSFIEDYGQGVERANEAIQYAGSGEDMMNVLTQRVNFKRAYSNAKRHLTDFAGIEYEGVRATIHDNSKLVSIQANAVLKYKSESAEKTLRDNADLWQTVHSVVYDVNAKTLRFVTQEIDGDAEPIVLDSIFAESFDKLAKQGDNPEATNTAIAALAASIGEKVGTLTALDSDIKAGKEALAARISEKGVTSSAMDSLAQMADSVHLIQQNTIELQGDKTYEQQMFGAETISTEPYKQNGPLWNLYKVMTDLLSDARFINYGGILLAEYYKGYDTIELMNAGAGGAYFTCDGDFYTTDKAGDNAHVWHDGDNGMANRWVAYLFAAPESNYTIPSTNLCPRSIHIGRKVGTIFNSFNGRISEIVVNDGNELVGINFGNNTNPWQKNVIIRNITNCDGYLLPQSNNNCVSLICDAKVAKSTFHIISGTASQLTSVYFPKLENVENSDRVFFLNAGQKAPSCINFEAPLLKYMGAQGFLYGDGASIKNIVFPSMETCNSWIFWGYNKLEKVILPKWTNTNTKIFWQSTTPNLIDVECGETKENISLADWNPTIVLSTPEGIATINANIRDHIAAKVSDRTGQTALTFTVSTNLYNNLEQATKDAFTAKNWRVAGA